MVGALEILLPGLFGLGAGLGGVALQSRLQRRDKDVDREFEKRAVLRSKAEEIYQEIESATERSVEALFDSLADFQGRADPFKRSPLTIRVDKLKALLLMYFPASGPILDEYDSAMFEPISAHSKRCETAHADASLDTSQKLLAVKESHLESAKASNAIVIKTMTELTVFMNKQVKGLL